MSPFVSLVINLLVWIAVIVFICWLVISKLRDKLEWPDLADFGEPKEIWLEGMEDLDYFPQYGYHRYRDVYMNMRRIPIVVLEPEIVNDQLAYKYVDIKTGEEGYDLPEFIMLLGREEPAKIVSF